MRDNRLPVEETVYRMKGTAQTGPEQDKGSTSEKKSQRLERESPIGKGARSGIYHLCADGPVVSFSSELPRQTHPWKDWNALVVCHQFRRVVDTKTYMPSPYLRYGNIEVMH